ncbi:polyprenyl synthetase family protein [Streptomyces sp. NPDC057680]|uniref:polyprenyl synthetase family protein n=1 Tax=Streptomyces sp. NPDC057680 TaxID=3346208 RepID=UPI0036B34890
MRTLDPPTVDRDVPAALALVLDDLLGRRLEEARALEGIFAADIAGRVAAFTARGGRRRRSQLLWWAMRACGGGGDETETALLTAAAVELVQTCALVHDDVMDGSSMRRGEPAVHDAVDRQYGTSGRPRPLVTLGGSAAILVGDLALTWADDTFAEALLTSPHSLALGRQWRAMRTEMIAGQYLDVHGQATNAHSPGRAIRTAILKTARYSAVHPLVIGALLAGAGLETVRGLSRAGLCAGIAFQLHDDLQGAFGDPGTTGKPAGDDVRAGKATYLMAVGREMCARRGDSDGMRLLETVVGCPTATDEQVRQVLDLLVAHGARAHVTARVERLCERAVRVLRGAAPVQQPAEHVARLLLDAGGVRLPGRSAVGGPCDAGRTDPGRTAVLTGRAR